MMKFAKSLVSLSLLAALTSANLAYAQDENVEVSSDIGTTREEIAAIQVLSEICPQIIGKNKNFDDGYQRILKDLLPGISDPVAAVKAYSQETDFQAMIKQAREDAAKASAEDNRQVCLDVIDW